MNPTPIIRCCRTVALTLALLSLSVFSACRNTGLSGDRGAYMILSLSLPAPDSRVLTDVEENHVQHIYVLMFDAQSGVYVDKAEGQQIQNVGTSDYKQFRVELPYGDFDLMVLANCKAQVDAAAFTAGASRTQVIDALKFTLDSWGASAQTFTPFPMWGELEDVEIDKNTDLSGTLIDMYRMTVRIDVTLSDAVYSTSSNRLVSARLYNRYTQGHIIPADGSYSKESDGSLTFLNPTLPQGAGKTPAPLLYTLETPGRSIESTIYTFEAARGTSDLLNNTCLVLGIGTQKEEGGGVLSIVPPGLAAEPETRAGKDDSTWYYRVDFTDLITGEFLPLMRNHNYLVTVTDILTHGFPDPDQAFRSEHYDLGYTVTAWEQHTHDYGTGGGPYRLDISETFYGIFWEDMWEHPKISTTYPGGWTYYVSNSPTQITTPPDWLAVSLDRAPDPYVTVTMTLDLLYDPGMGERAYIHIVAGNLTNIIFVGWPDDISVGSLIPPDK